MMQLKPYQQQVLSDLDTYLSRIDNTQGLYAKAFNQFWEEKLGPYNPLTKKGMTPYKDNVPGVPNVCVKVPTAGGKTFIACHALKTIYDHYHFNTAKAVVWLVPGVTILEQTLKNLSNPQHPYRMAIDRHFNSRVQVYDKEALLNPRGFTGAAVQEQLSIFVLSFDTFRSRSKENRKIYQENGMLIGHNVKPDAVMAGTDETALINVIRSLNPVVIVDESHNAESDLSLEMLANLLPSFILDLTATPRNNSNIISFVDALQLKKENMVKLPVIVYNHKSKNGVVESAIKLRYKLEQDAKAERKNGGAYIRPIVLFQAQPRTGEEQTTFEKIKQQLLELGIPAEQIKIKTADINELKNENLMSEQSKVRFIITVNALKEGWDCPFAYVLASLADKSSAIDIEQIVGRILRQPYATPHKNPMLNMSFVLTSSARFQETLGSIVNGLNKAGFSPKDYTVANDEMREEETAAAPAAAATQLILEQQSNVAGAVQNVAEEEIDTSWLKTTLGSAIVAAENSEQSSTDSEDDLAKDEVLNDIAQQAQAQSEALQQKVALLDASGAAALPTEIADSVNIQHMAPSFESEAASIRLPQFVIQEEGLLNLMNDGNDTELLSSDNLLDGFRLSQEDTKIDFDAIRAEIVRIDLEQTKEGETDVRMSEVQKKYQPVLLEYFSGEIDERAKSQLHNLLFKVLGNMPPIADSEIKKYLRKIVEGLMEHELKELATQPYLYAPRIKEKIQQLSQAVAEKQFNAWLDTDKIMVQDRFQFKPQIIHKALAAPISKSLYERETEMNGFEEKIALRLSGLDNVLFWHKNPEKKGFCLNGFINHYPDFIVVTQSKRVILIETKGDHLDGSDSQAKIRLGQKWAEKAGNMYRYYMVFESRIVPGAITVDELLDRVGRL